MKHKTSELKGALLDAAVALAAGKEFSIEPYRVSGDYGITFVRSEPVCLIYGIEHFEPSSVWATGGPIIERERIGVAPYLQDGAVMWAAWIEEECSMATFESYFERGIFDDTARGQTPLIAAMRAYVASRFGEEVELVLNP